MTLFRFVDLLTTKRGHGIAGEWRRVSLGDLIEVKHGFAFQGEFFREEPPGDILLTPGNFAIGGGFKGDKLKYYIGPVPAEFVLAENDLLVTMTDPSKSTDTLGYPALVPSSNLEDRFLHNQRLGKVLVKHKAPVEKRFLYYVLCSREYRDEVIASATGTTVKHTSPSRIHAFQFDLPLLPEQRAIAHILGTLDDKVELNRRMNATLEAMARALFFTTWPALFPLQKWCMPSSGSQAHLTTELSTMNSNPAPSPRCATRCCRSSSPARCGWRTSSVL